MFNHFITIDTDNAVIRFHSRLAREAGLTEDIIRVVLADLTVVARAISDLTNATYTVVGVL